MKRLGVLLISVLSFASYVLAFELDHGEVVHLSCGSDYVWEQAVVHDENPPYYPDPNHVNVRRNVPTSLRGSSAVDCQRAIEQSLGVNALFCEKSCGASASCGKRTSILRGVSFEATPTGYCNWTLSDQAAIAFSCPCQAASSSSGSRSSAPAGGTSVPKPAWNQTESQSAMVSTCGAGPIEKKVTDFTDAQRTFMNVKGPNDCREQFRERLKNSLNCSPGRCSRCDKLIFLSGVEVMVAPDGACKIMSAIDSNNPSVWLDCSDCPAASVPATGIASVSPSGMPAR